jgi:hypothetical protein
MSDGVIEVEGETQGKVEISTASGDRGPAKQLTLTATTPANHLAAGSNRKRSKSQSDESS